MSEPVLNRQGARLRERTQPLAPDDDANGWAHAGLCGGFGIMLDQVGEVWDPPDGIPPGAPLVDPTLAPDWALPWVAQLVGVRLPAGLTPDQQRTVITEVGGWHRGSPDALRAAAGLALTGTKTVYFRERDGGDAYALGVRTLIAETPDPAQVLRLLMAQKPGGIVLTYSTVQTWDWEQVVIEQASWTTLMAAYATWQDVLEKHHA